MDWTAIGTIAALVLSLFSVLGVWVVPRSIERSRRRHQAAQSHLAEIKSAIYTPMLNRLELYYLPILTHERRNVISQQARQRSKSTPIDEYPMGFVLQLSVFTMQDLMEEHDQTDMMRDFDGKQPTAETLEVDVRLHLDVKERHEKDFVRRWETFVADVDDFNARCLGRIGDISEQIVDQSGLAAWPSYDGRTPGINASELAIFVWETQLAQRRSTLVIHESGPQWQLRRESQIVGIGSQQEMQDCWDVVSDLGRDPTGAEEAPETEAAALLTDRAHSLLNELGDLSRSHTLKNTCPYIKQ